MTEMTIIYFPRNRSSRHTAVLVELQGKKRLYWSNKAMLWCRNGNICFFFLEGVGGWVGILTRFFFVLRFLVLKTRPAKITSAITLPTAPSTYTWSIYFIWKLFETSCWKQKTKTKNWGEKREKKRYGAPRKKRGSFSSLVILVFVSLLLYSRYISTQPFFWLEVISSPSDFTRVVENLSFFLFSHLLFSTPQKPTLRLNPRPHPHPSFHYLKWSHSWIHSWRSWTRTRSREKNPRGLRKTTWRRRSLPWCRWFCRLCRSRTRTVPTTPSTGTLVSGVRACCVRDNELLAEINAQTKRISHAFYIFR